MKKIMVELEEGDVARLEAVAQQCGIDVATLAKHALRNVAEKGAAAVHGVQAAMQPTAAYLVKCSGGDAAEGATQAAGGDAGRQARFAALMASSGIWAGEPGMPKDGPCYQQKLRAEWL